MYVIEGNTLKAPGYIRKIGSGSGTGTDETEIRTGGISNMRKFKDKFNLTQQQSLFLAKKKWDENVYCGMRMENRAVTFPQTLTILQDRLGSHPLSGQ